MPNVRRHEINRLLPWQKRTELPMNLHEQVISRNVAIK